jgi:uncharacterized membrane protein
MKIATYSTMHFGVAFGMAYALTGNLRTSGAIALVERAVQTVAYAIHKRAWFRQNEIQAVIARGLGRAQPVRT